MISGTTTAIVNTPAYTSVYLTQNAAAPAVSTNRLLLDAGTDRLLLDNGDFLDLGAG